MGLNPFDTDPLEPPLKWIAVAALAPADPFMFAGYRFAIAEPRPPRTEGQVQVLREGYRLWLPAETPVQVECTDGGNR